MRPELKARGSGGAPGRDAPLEAELEFEARLLLESERLREGGTGPLVLPATPEELDAMARRLVPLARARWAELLPVTEGFGVRGEYWTLEKEVGGARAVLAASGEVFLLRERCTAWVVSVGVTTALAGSIALFLWLSEALGLMGLPLVARLPLGLVGFLGTAMLATYASLWALWRLPLSRLIPWTPEGWRSEFLERRLVEELTRAVEKLERARAEREEEAPREALRARLARLGLEPAGEEEEVPR